MSNTVGNLSANFCNFYENCSHAYILGLWCADGYHRTSSIGLSSIRPELTEKFRVFLSSIFPEDRLCLRTYKSETNSGGTLSFGINKNSILTSKKAKHTAYQVYVNSRPLLIIREFEKAKREEKLFLDSETGWAYLAGRFDGDGTVGRDLKRNLRICYTTLEDARKDYELLCDLGLKKSKIYRYETSHTFVIYISRLESYVFVKKCLSSSNKLQKLALKSRRDLVLSEAKPDSYTFV